MSRRLEPAQAAARLNVGVNALPHGGPWTRERVRGLRAERPDWLTRARRAYAAGRDAEAEGKWRAVDALLDEGGYTRPDDGSDDMFLYAGEALLWLLHRGVAHDDAEAAIDRRWPSSCADDEEVWEQW
jgi:hypothetical protein